MSLTVRLLDDAVDIGIHGAGDRLLCLSRGVRLPWSEIVAARATTWADVREGLGWRVGGGYLPATSFQYRNVGVNLSLTPKVAASGDITLEMAAEFSLLGEDRNVGTAASPLSVPTFLTRNVTGTLLYVDAGYHAMGM